LGIKECPYQVEIRSHGVTAGYIMNHLDLFSGIGGFSLAAQWVWGEDHNIVAFVEQNKFCQKVLHKHWPDVPIINDVRDVYRFTHEYEDVFGDGENMLCERHDMDFADCECIGCSQFDDEYGYVDLITGGFPCQDISNAITTQGIPEGLKGEKSSLWFEFKRIISNIQPRWVVIENVGAISVRGLSEVIKGLSEIGYSSEWQIISARDIGAWHLRKRMFIVSYPNSEGLEGDVSKVMERKGYWRQYANIARPGWRSPTPRICGKPHGIPNRMDRLKSLGNAIVPQVAQVIMEAIKEISDENMFKLR